MRCLPATVRIHVERQLSNPANACSDPKEMVMACSPNVRSVAGTGQPEFCKGGIREIVTIPAFSVSDKPPGTGKLSLLVSHAA
jgi:hypothetical protein